MKFTDVLVPVDFSEPSVRALRMAVDLVRATGGKVVLLHVGVATQLVAGDLGGPSVGLIGNLGVEVLAEQRARLQALAEAEVPDGLSGGVVLREGNPATEILAQIDAEGLDLVVMGTHGRKGLRRALLGSVTERVVRESAVPCLVTH